LPPDHPLPADLARPADVENFIGMRMPRSPASTSR
jgi:hypothetical protein